ncbi:hypothetical protein BDV96DRAFT_287920 [Lophiotrema nucula]|uniref:Heterokaryon incompatibility protein-domain-containing protein n=1 Tax=Lophiotrema nucula TaxID=690887 RepID=A0A6A5YKY8_9PLEO|nr:hypothetical protein BDV96DRAFT_287920 [Lophiotrema nucula]
MSLMRHAAFNVSAGFSPRDVCVVERFVRYTCNKFFDVWHLTFADNDGASGSNPLDTVYAFLGHPAAFNARFNSVLQDMDYERMAGERSTIVLPDYDTKLFALYRNLALAVINGVDSGSDLLRYVAHADEESLYSDPLPNWVPRYVVSVFHSGYRRGKLYFLNSTHHCSVKLKSIRWDISAVPRAFAPPASVYYNASGSLPRHPLKVIDKTYLRMKAIRIDTITFSWTFLDSSWFFIWGTKFKYSVIANGQAISNEDSNPVEYLWAAFEKRRASLPNGHLNDIVAYCTTLTAGLTGNAKPVGSNSRSHFANFCAYRLAKAERWGIPQLPPGTRAQLEEDSKEGDADQYFCDVERACGNRAFFCTEKGYIGLGPRVMGDEDEVWLPMGSMVPFVLRSTYGRHGDCYRVLGQAYVHGFMEGEAVRDLEEDDFQEIVLC